MYTVIVNGVAVQCETAAEVVELTRQAGDGAAHSHAPKGHRPSDANTGAPGSRWTEQRIKEFFRQIKAQQRKLIDVLLEWPDGRTDEQLVQHLGLADGRALAGVFTGLWKNAKKVGADPKELYRRQNVMIGDRRQGEYTLTEAFRGAAEKWK